MIVVTGATGAVGGELVRQLHAAGHPVRALSRHPERATLPDGVELAAADLSDPTSLPAAFAGATAAFLYAVPDGAKQVAAAARDAGIQRVVLLSSASVAGPTLDAERNPIGARHRLVEAALEESGLAWTFLRPGAFAGNTRWWSGQLRSGDVVRGPYPELATAPIHEADIAAVAAVALTADGHAGKAYLLTGPEPLSQADQVRILGEVLGRPLRFDTVTQEEARRMMARDIDERWVDNLLGMQRKMLGAPVTVSGAVTAVTGRPGRTFADWVADHRADF